MVLSRDNITFEIFPYKHCCITVQIYRRIRNLDYEQMIMKLNRFHFVVGLTICKSYSMVLRLHNYIYILLSYIIFDPTVKMSMLVIYSQDIFKIAQLCLTLCISHFSFKTFFLGMEEGLILVFPLKFVG